MSMDYATCLATSGLAVRDAHTPDGCVAGGCRLLRHGDWVRFISSWWHHRALEQHVGDHVWCEALCYRYTEAGFSFERNGKYFREVKGGKSKRETA